MRAGLTINAPLILKVLDIIFFSRTKHLIICFAPDKKKISRTVKIIGALVFLCPKERERERERKQERDRQREREREHEREREREGDREQEREREERGERREERREKREERRETRDERARERVSERIKVRTIIFLNCPGQNEKSANY